MTWELPTALTVNGTERPINSDFRDVLTILEAYDDPDLEPSEKVYVCLAVLYADFEDMPREDYGDAYEQATWFLDGGNDRASESRKKARTVDWVQDTPILFPSVNQSAGFEVRSVDYMHWWTFLGYFMEMQKSTYATVLSLRDKKARGKKLEKWEQEFWSAHKDLCVIRPKLTAEEKEEKERLLAILDNL